MKNKPIKMLIKQANVVANRQRAKFATSLGITGVQMGIIDFLSDRTHQRASQHDIEQELGIRRSTTTVLVQKMEKDGLIERSDDPNDKRKKLVQLLPKATKLVDQIKEYVKEDDLELLSHFSKQEIEATKKVLEFIREEGTNG